MDNQYGNSTSITNQSQQIKITIIQLFTSLIILAICARIANTLFLVPYTISTLFLLPILAIYLPTITGILGDLFCRDTVVITTKVEKYKSVSKLIYRGNLSVNIIADEVPTSGHVVEYLIRLTNNHRRLSITRELYKEIENRGNYTIIYLPYSGEILSIKKEESDLVRSGKP
jgi:hypothetical protein